MKNWVSQWDFFYYKSYMHKDGKTHQFPTMKVWMVKVIRVGGNDETVLIKEIYLVLSLLGNSF